MLGFNRRNTMNLVADNTRLQNLVDEYSKELSTVRTSLGLEQVHVDELQQALNRQNEEVKRLNGVIAQYQLDETKLKATIARREHEIQGLYRDLGNIPAIVRTIYGVV